MAKRPRRTNDDLEWLVDRRNDVQSLLLHLRVKWRTLPDDHRQASLGAAFALWRAVFLVDIEKEDGSEPAAERDEAAQEFLDHLIETNMISFTQDRTHNAWTAGYYSGDALFRVNELRAVTGKELVTPGVGSLRKQWWRLFKKLADFLEYQVRTRPPK